MARCHWVSPGCIARRDQQHGLDRRDPARSADVATAADGNGGDGAILTRAGKTVIERYRAIEMDTAMAARKHLLALNRGCANRQSLPEQENAG